MVTQVVIGNPGSLTDTQDQTMVFLKDCSQSEGGRALFCAGRKRSRVQSEAFCLGAPGGLTVTPCSIREAMPWQPMSAGSVFSCLTAKFPGYRGLEFLSEMTPVGKVLSGQGMCSTAPPLPQHQASKIGGNTCPAHLRKPLILESLGPGAGG
jgi:hypothetical protein